ncbi:MAG TPA: PAS domain S-box protein [Candidatus Saccharimonadales bacterium]|nr:PAS domain S-box protein [Candidatus Saccharimonadales bacterium]
MWVELMTSFYDLSLGIASLFLLAALMWSVSLRRRVKEQMVQIKDQVVREVELQNRYKELFENANDVVFSMDTEGYFATLNRSGESIFGISRKQASTTRLRDLLLPEFVVAYDAWMEELGRNVSPARCDVEAYGKERQAVALEINARPIFENQKLTSIEGIARDATQRKRAEAALKQSEERFSSAFRVSPVAIAIQTQWDERFQDANQSFMRLFETESKELLNSTADELGIWASPEEHQKVKGLLRETGSIGGMECSFKTKTGKLRTGLIFMEVLKMGNVPCVLFIVHDLTERLALENHLRQSQKLEAVGRLAAGVAHDFNNLLTVIQGNIELLRIKQQLPPEADRPLAHVSDAAEKAAGLVKQLLTFSRKQVLQTKILSLNDLITDCTKVIQHLLPSDILLKYRFGAGLPLLQADAVMMEQILLNLAVNARDAMPKGGQMVISTQLVEFEENRISTSPQARAGRFLCLSVADNGCGMDPETQARIFEPFFTTKSADKGTGLGLATVYGAVQQHQGWIELQSAVGQGSTFRIYFPCDGRPEVPAAPEYRNPKESKTILVVEDDTNVLEFVRLALQTVGYTVVEAMDGLEALEKWSQHRADIDLLFTDMKMPKGMSGAELAENLKALKPDLRIIYTSGYSPDTFSKNLRLQEGLNYLPKPYPPPRLVETIRACLESKVAPGLN